MSKRFLAATLFGVVAAVAAYGEGIDPYIHIGDPDAGTPVGPNFTFSANANGGGVFDFVNASNVTFTSLDFFSTLPSGDFVFCVPTPFYSTCETTEAGVGGGKSMFDVGLDIGPDSTGIAPGAFFQIILNYPVDGKDNLDPNGYGGWGPGNSVDAVANMTGTPEPATWALLATGFGAALALTRKRPFKR